jgi:hypothetical protein
MTAADFTTDLDHVLTAEQRVFARCVADVLEHAPGLQYHLLAEPPANPNLQSTTYATFLIETNPRHDLTVSLELSDRRFVIRVNSEPFVRPRNEFDSFEHWVDRACRAVARLTHPHLRLTQHLFVSRPTSSTLEAGDERRWRPLGETERAWAGMLGIVLPFGVALLFTREREFIYHEWYRVEEGGG